MAERGRPGDADESQAEEDQGDGCHPCLLVGDASQDGIESQKIPLGNDVRWGVEWVGVDRVVWVAKGDGGETCAKCFELKLIAGIHEVIHEVANRGDGEEVEKVGDPE